MKSLRTGETYVFLPGLTEGHAYPNIGMAIGHGMLLCRDPTGGELIEPFGVYWLPWCVVDAMNGFRLCDAPTRREAVKYAYFHLKNGAKEAGTSIDDALRSMRIEAIERFRSDHNSRAIGGLVNV